MTRIICWLRGGHVWRADGYRLAYVPGGRRYVERCIRCPAERTVPAQVEHDEEKVRVASACGHPQEPPTDQEIDGCPEIIVRNCPVCASGLWWNINQWRKL